MLARLRPADTPASIALHQSVSQIGDSLRKAIQGKPDQPNAESREELSTGTSRGLDDPYNIARRTANGRALMDNWISMSRRLICECSWNRSHFRFPLSSRGISSNERHEACKQRRRKIFRLRQQKNFPSSAAKFSYRLSLGFGN
jgi:hypothetical protein